jgi:two-component system LytT family response regulator
MIRAVLAGDEPFSRERLREMLIPQNVNVVAESCLCPDMIEVLRTTKPDLLFVDLRTAENTSLEVLERMSSHLNLPLPAIIYTANEGKTASRYTDIPGAHCLSTPFTPERLGIAIERAVRQIEPETQPLQNNGNHATSYSKRIIIRSRGRIIFIPVSTIRWIAAEENYVRISTEAETHLLREPISRLEEKLDPQMFRRVHRSSIVNLEYVKEVRTQSNGESVVILFNGHKLAMSRSYRSRMNQWLMSS